MNDNDILKAAQENPQEMGEYEKLISNRSVLFGFMFGIVILLSMIIVEWIIRKQIDFGKPALLFSICAVIDIYDGIKRKKKLTIFLGVFMTLLFILFFIAFIGEMFV